MFATLAFIVGAGYLPWTVSAASVGRWSALTIGVPLLLLVERQHSSTVLVVRWGGVALLLWIAISFFWTIEPWDTFGRAIQLLTLAGVFYLAQAEQEIFQVYRAFILGVSLSLPFAGLQYLGWNGVETVSFQGGAWYPVGLFLSKNGLGEVSAIALLLALGMRKPWLAVAPALLLILSHSRESAAMIAIGLLVLMWHLRCLRALLLLAFCSICVLVFLNQPTTIYGRLDIWLDTIYNLHPIGWGLGTYADSGPAAAGYEFAHNDFLQLVFELGIGATALFVIIAYALPAIPQEPATGAAMAALLVAAATWFPLELPATAFIFAALLGRLVAVRYRLRVVQFIRRRASLPSLQVIHALRY